MSGLEVSAVLKFAVVAAVAVALGFVLTEQLSSLAATAAACVREK